MDNLLALKKKCDEVLTDGGKQIMFINRKSSISDNSTYTLSFDTPVAFKKHVEHTFMQIAEEAKNNGLDVKVEKGSITNLPNVHAFKLTVRDTSK